MTKKKTTSELELEVMALSVQLENERSRKRILLENLGKMRFRVIEVLQLDLDAKNEILYEIDKVFGNSP